jgi:[acyl-carrier-protein] S-malonyltransferase
MSEVAWVFPGQGSQRTGMGADARDRSSRAAKVVDTVDEALGYSLSDIIFNGTAECLVSTRVQQPAILTASIAYLEALKETGNLPAPACVAGHSLGEYSAMVAAGALDLADAARLVQRRGELMEEHGLGGMLAVIGLDQESLEAITAEAGVEIANFNAPGQTTLSGHAEALVRAGAIARERGARRVLPLPVNGAFHSSLMRPVAEQLWPMIRDTEFRAPAVPVMANVDARLLTEPDELRVELREQITASVRWVDVIQAASAQGARRFIEVGPGKVLAGLVSRIVPNSEVVTAEELLSG